MKNAIAAAILSAAAVLAFGGLAQSVATTAGSVSVVEATVTVATATPASGAGEAPQADTHWG